MRKYLRPILLIYILAIVVGGVVFAKQSRAQGTFVFPGLEPICYLKYLDNHSEKVSCNGKISLPAVGQINSGTPDFDALARADPNINHGLQNDKCYITGESSPGIIEDNIYGGAFCEFYREQAGNPAVTPVTPSAGGGSTSTAATPATPGTASTTGNAPIENNAKKADPTKPTITRKGGFEEVDDKCNVGNQGKDCAVTDRLSSIADVLSVGVGVVVVIMIIVGGIQYTMAGSDPQKIATAKGHILNAIIALVAFFFLFAFLQWVVPGGIFL